MPATTPRGAPYPLGTDNNDGPGAFFALATWTQDRPGIQTLTTAQRDVLTGGNLWVGRVIFNTTTNVMEFWSGSSWAPVGTAGGSGLPVLTTAARNALSGGSLYRGLTIFNSDTGAVEVYYGATTSWRPPWNTPWGEVPSGYVEASTNGTANAVVTGSETDLAGLTVTVSPIANRKLRITGAAWFGSITIAGNVSARLFEAGSAVDDNPMLTLGVGGVVGARFVYHSVAPGGSVIYKLRAGIVGGGGTATRIGQVWERSFVLVEDIGPSGNAPAS